MALHSHLPPPSPTMIAHPPSSGKLLSFTPESAPCPRCGATTFRNEVRERILGAADLHGPVEYRVEFSCFICPDHPPGERWFTALPADLSDAHRYTVPTRVLVMSLVVEHKMSFQHAAAFAKTHLHVPVVPATVMRWLRAGCPTAEERAERERALLARFSGQLAVDEVYSGGQALLKATDPLLGDEIAYEFVHGSVNEKVIAAFFQRLKDRGFDPLIVTTDGAAIYPPAIAAVWPRAQHQGCVFHFLQGWTKRAMRAVWHCHALMPAPKNRGPGRPKKHGRPRMDAAKRRNKDLVRKSRHLFLKRPENLTEEEEGRLRQAIGLYAALGTLRELVVAVYDLFGPQVQEPDEARRRRREILENKRFRLPFLEPLLNALEDEVVFERLIVALRYENAERTTNHVERQNREYRKRQKSHYRLRTRRSEDALLARMLFLPRKPPSRHPTGAQKLVPRRPPTAAFAPEVPLAS